ncbi:MAG TPA: hypothetical protein VEL05_06855 [Candidatus Acidoferrum sp.]|nr:hypothetical protein [Candidatus Acidoferrum sp.]
MAAMRRRLRWSVFLAAAAWMLLSPAYVQVLGQRSRVVRPWQMFHRRGVGICSARYDDRGRPIDRYGLLGVERASAPVQFRRIVDEGRARAMGRRICEALGPGADVRVQLRCGERDGLRQVLDREENLCGR